MTQVMHQNSQSMWSSLPCDGHLPCPCLMCHHSFFFPPCENGWHLPWGGASWVGLSLAYRVLAVVCCPGLAVKTEVPLLGSCVGYFSCCCDRIPDKSSLRKGGFILLHSSRVHSPPWWEGMTAGPGGCWTRHTWSGSREVDGGAPCSPLYSV